MTGRRQAGFALLIVLWTVVLLTLLVTHIEATGRSEAQLALNLRRSAALQAEADGAIAVGAFHLLDASAAHWTANGAPHVLRVRNGGFTRRVVVRITDQAGKINLNSAPVPLLQALIAAVGVGPAEASRIAANIGAWRYPAGTGPAANSIAAQYKAAGRGYAPPHAPFESLSELGLVLGMTPRLLALLRQHLTLFHPGEPNLARADRVVRQAFGVSDAMPGFNPHPVGGLRVVAITATASGAGGIAFSRHAIVQVGPQKGGWLRILTWTAPRRGGY
jgi:general secretion pathway protein K